MARNLRLTDAIITEAFEAAYREKFKKQYQNRVFQRLITGDGLTSAVMEAPEIKLKEQKKERISYTNRNEAISSKLDQNKNRQFIIPPKYTKEEFQTRMLAAGGDLAKQEQLFREQIGLSRQLMRKVLENFNLKPEAINPDGGQTGPLFYERWTLKRAFESFRPGSLLVTLEKKEDLQENQNVQRDHFRFRFSPAFKLLLIPPALLIPSSLLPTTAGIESLLQEEPAIVGALMITVGFLSLAVGLALLHRCTQQFKRQKQDLEQRIQELTNINEALNGISPENQSALNHFFKNRIIIINADKIEQAETRLNSDPARELQTAFGHGQSLHPFVPQGSRQPSSSACETYARYHKEGLLLPCLKQALQQLELTDTAKIIKNILLTDDQYKQWIRFDVNQHEGIEISTGMATESLRQTKEDTPPTYALLQITLTIDKGGETSIAYRYGNNLTLPAAPTETHEEQRSPSPGAQPPRNPDVSAASAGAMATRAVSPPL